MCRHDIKEEEGKYKYEKDPTYFHQLVLMHLEMIKEIQVGKRKVAGRVVGLLVKLTGMDSVV